MLSGDDRQMRGGIGDVRRIGDRLPFPQKETGPAGSTRDSSPVEPDLHPIRRMRRIVVHISRLHALPRGSLTPSPHRPVVFEAFRVMRSGRVGRVVWPGGVQDAGNNPAVAASQVDACCQELVRGPRRKP